ncbi:MAG: hypothetical protein E6J41_30265 [Chloroflexi bacterium]|nr:MAG: hypothetical protein E6J41_30265 [Chloroflexota bacterium]
MRRDRERGTLPGMARSPVVPLELTGGPFTIDEAKRAGLTWKQLQGASWRRIAVGQYVWAGLNASPGLVLATVRRRLPPGAVFSGQTAAWAHGLDVAQGDPVEVTVPTRSPRSAITGVLVRRADLPPDDMAFVGGLPVTSALRTVVDLARRLPLVEAVVTADMALHGRLVQLAELRRFISADGRSKGIVQLRNVVDLAEPGAESPMETRLRLLLVLAGLPRPRVQVPLYDNRGRFLGRPDLYYPLARLGLEYDGGTHRQLLRFTAADLRGSPNAVVTQVRNALKGDASDGSP